MRHQRQTRLGRWALDKLTQVLRDSFVERYDLAGIQMVQGHCIYKPSLKPFSPIRRQ